MGKFTAVINWDGAHVAPNTIKLITSLPSDFSLGSPKLLIKGNLGFGYLAHDPKNQTHQGNQPLVSEENRFILVCDARIDNRQELIDQLFDTTHAPPLLSDANIILSAYRQWGQQCPTHLIGDFAFVIWDDHKKTMFAARDAMNMRTISYTQSGNTLCIATEGTQLLQHPAISAKINKHALASWISGWPDPNLSMFDGIQLLPAGHSLVADKNGIKIERYWALDPVFKIRHNSISTYEEQLREILSRSISDRMHTSSNIIASQMSGGMDSTSVTALANKQASITNKQVHVISHTYKTLASCDESERINEMLQHLNIKNAHFMAAEQHADLDFRDLYPPSIENPGTVCSPRYIDEMKLIKSIGADVLLTGSGGDEMAWGHSLTYSRRLLRGDFSAIQEVIHGCKEMQLPLLSTLLHLFVIPFIPQRVKQGIRKLRGKSTDSTIPVWVTDATKQLLKQNEARISDTVEFHNPALQARYDAWINSSTINSVRSYHQAGELFGIEVRHPFFDRRLVEFSFAIPDDLWIRDGYPKWLLRRSMTGILPNSVCWNKNKIIFDSFFAKIIRTQHETIRHILSDKRLEEMGLVDNGKLIQALDTLTKNPEKSLNVNLLYALMAQIWFQQHAHVFAH